MEIGARIMKEIVWGAFFGVLVGVLFFLFASTIENLSNSACAKGQTFTYAGNTYECVVNTTTGDE